MLTRKLTVTALAATVLAVALPSAPAATAAGPRALATGVVAPLRVALATGDPMIDHTQGTAGYCKDDKGTTMVVDLQDLKPGRIVIRCFPGKPDGSPATGYEAMQGAGFRLEGTKHDGDGFVCRIGGRPARTDEIDVPGNPRYREKCGATPPAAAYWSYWHAPNSGKREYSQWGIMNRKVIPGGFDGWSFSHNATAATNPAPRVKPVRR